MDAHRLRFDSHPPRAMMWLSLRFSEAFRNGISLQPEGTRMRRWAWVAMWALMLGGAQAQDARDLRVVPRADGRGHGGRFAVLVAVGDYEDPNISRLKYAAADAEGLYALLTDPAVGGFAAEDVVLLTDKAPDAVHKPTRNNILAMLTATSKRAANPADTILFFFAGHGIEEDGQTYLLSRDALASIPAQSGVELAAVRKLLTGKDCRAARKIIFLDCCHSGEPGRAAGGAMSDAFYQELNRWEGMVTFSACTQKEKSYDFEEKGHGAFTWFLLDGLRGAADAAGDKDGFVDLGELQKYVWQKTSAWAVQRRLVQNPFCRVEATGVVYLTRAAGGSGIPVVQPPKPETPVPMTTTLKIGCEVDGASIYLNGQLVGTTRAGHWVPLANVPVGAVRLRVLKEGLPAWESEVQASAAGENQVVVPLQTRPKLTVYKEWPFDAAEAKRRQEETGRALGLKGVEEEVDLGGGVKLTLVLIPAGEFLMGSAETSEELARMYSRFKAEAKWFDPEHPQHRVRITKPFWMGKYELTQEQWEAVMGDNPSQYKGPKNPVESVSWNEVQGFLQKLNARAAGGGFALPTEAQWEYACRAGSGDQFSFGNAQNSLHRYGNYADKNTNLDFSDKEADDGFPNTAPVGRFLANAFGLHDMHGNVLEWCSDWYGERYYDAPPSDDPTGPADGRFRVLGGGSWGFNPSYCRSAYRGWDVPTARYVFVGFRVVRSARTSE